MIRKLKSILRALLPTSVHSHAIKTGPLLGHRIVNSWHDYPAAILGYAERPLLEWFSRNIQSGETWLDVGAHYGYTAIALSKLVGSDGRVFAFEPMISTAGHLTQTRFQNNFRQLRVLPFALGDSEEISLFELPTWRGMVESVQREISSPWKEVIVSCALDWLWPQICGTQSKIDGVKIDVQGMEIQVVRGMRETLHKFKPKLVIEVHPGVNRNEFLSLLDEIGYSREAIPVELLKGVDESSIVDDRSYEFRPRKDIQGQGSKQL